MDAERWQKIERVFHAALQAEPDKRAAILSDLCAGDESLRREVESLLAHHENAHRSAGTRYIQGSRLIDPSYEGHNERGWDHPNEAGHHNCPEDQCE